MFPVEEPPVIADTKKSKEELNKEIDDLINDALKGNKEAAKRAEKLAKLVLRRGR